VRFIRCLVGEFTIGPFRTRMFWMNLSAFAVGLRGVGLWCGCGLRSSTDQAFRQFIRAIGGAVVRRGSARQVIHLFQRNNHT